MKRCLKRGLRSLTHDDNVLAKRSKCLEKLSETMSSNIGREKKGLDLNLSTTTRRKSKRFSINTDCESSILDGDRISKSDNDFNPSSETSAVVIDTSSKDSTSLLGVTNESPLSNEPEKWKFVSLDFHKYLLPKYDSTVQTDPKIRKNSSCGKNVKRNKTRKVIPPPKIAVINDPYSDSWIDHEKDGGSVSHLHEKIGLLTRIGVGRPVFPLIHRNIVTICGRRNHTEITSTWAEFALSTLVTDKPKAKLILLPVVDSELTRAVEDFNRKCFKNLTEVEIVKGSAAGAPRTLKCVVLESKNDEKNNFRLQSPRTDVGSLLVSDLVCQDNRRLATDNICVESISYCSVEDNSCESAEEKVRPTFASSIAELENPGEQSIKGKLDSQLENNSLSKLLNENATDSNVGIKICSHYGNNGVPELAKDDPTSQFCDYKHSNSSGAIKENGSIFISVDLRYALLGTGTGKWHRCGWNTCGHVYGEQKIDHQLCDGPMSCSLVEHTTNPCLTEKIYGHSDNGLATDLCAKKDIVCQPVPTSVSRLLVEVACDSNAAEKLDENQFTYSAMSRASEEDESDCRMREQIDQLLMSKSLINEIRDSRVEDQMNRQVVDSLISRSLDENRNESSAGSVESSTVSKSLVIDFTREQIDHQIDSIPVSNLPVYAPKRKQTDCPSESNPAMSVSVDRSKEVSESGCAENSSMHELTEQLDHQPESSSVSNSLSGEQRGDSIDFHPENVHLLVDEFTGEQTDCHSKSSPAITSLSGSLRGKPICSQPESGLMNSLVDEHAGKQIDPQTRSSPLMNCLVDEPTGEQTDHQFESSSVNETRGDSVGPQLVYSPAGEPVGLKSELSPEKRNELTGEQIDRFPNFSPKSISSVDVRRRAIIGEQPDHQFRSSPELKSPSESIITTCTGDNSDAELENNPTVMSLLEAFGDSDEFDEGVSDESSDESLDSEIMIFEDRHPEYVRFYEAVGGVKRIIDNVEIKSDIENLPVTNSSLELMDDSPDEKCVPKLSLPQCVKNCEQRSLTDEEQFEPKIVCEPTICCVAKKRTARRSKVVPVSSSKRPFLRNRRLIREKMVSDEWYYGNNVISPLRAFRSLNASREQNRPQIDWNEAARKRGFKRCWVAVKRVQATTDCRNCDDDWLSSFYGERRVHKTMLNWFNELARGKLPDELRRMKVKRSCANSQLKNVPMVGVQHDEADESPGDHVFGFQHCTRTYGVYLDYVSRNRSFLYAYKMRRSLKFQKKNNKYFRSSRYCRIVMDGGDPSFVDVVTEYADVNGDTNNSSVNPLEMIPMPRGNTFGASVIKEMSSENEQPIHFVESTSLKRGVNYNWLVLNIAKDIDRVVIGGEHVLSAKLLFEVMYRADLTKKLVCSEIGEEACDEILKFGVYGIPSICNIVLVGPYPLSQRFPVVQVALTVDIVNNVSVKQQSLLNVCCEGDSEAVSAIWWVPQNLESLNPRVTYLNFLFGLLMPPMLESSREMISIGNLMVNHEAKTYVSYHTTTKESNFLLLHDLLDSTLVERKKLAENPGESTLERESKCSGSKYEDSDSSYSVASKRVETITNADTRKRKKIQRDSKELLTLEKTRRRQFCHFRDNLRSILDDSEKLDSLKSILNKATITIRSINAQERNLVRQKVKLRRGRRNLANRNIALLKELYSGSKLTALKKRLMPDFTVPRRAEDIGRAFKKIQDAEMSKYLIPDSLSSSGSVASFQPVVVSTKSVSPQRAADEGPIISSVRSVARRSQHPSRRYAGFFDEASDLHPIHFKNSISPSVGACESAIEEPINAEAFFVPAILRKRAPLNRFKSSGKSVSLVMVPSRASAVTLTSVDDCISSAKSSSLVYDSRCTQKTVSPVKSGPLVHRSRSRRKTVKPIKVSSETLIHNPSFVVKSEPGTTAPSGAIFFDVSSDAPVIIKKKRSKRPSAARGIRQQPPSRRSQRKKKKNRRFYESPERDDDVKSNEEPLPLVIPGDLEAAFIDHPYSRRAYKYLINDDPLDDPSITKVDHRNRISEQTSSCSNSGLSSRSHKAVNRISVYLLENERPITKLHINRTKKFTDFSSSETEIKMNHLIQILLETLKSRQKKEKLGEASSLTYYLTILEQMLSMSKNKPQPGIDSSTILIISDDNDNIDLYKDNKKYSCRIVRSNKESRFLSQDVGEACRGNSNDSEKDICPPWYGIPYVNSYFGVDNEVIFGTEGANSSTSSLPSFKFIEEPSQGKSSQILRRSIRCSTSDTGTGVKRKPVTTFQKTNESKRRRISPALKKGVKDTLSLPTYPESSDTRSHDTTDDCFVETAEVCEAKSDKLAHDSLPNDPICTGCLQTVCEDATCDSGNESDPSTCRISFKSFASLKVLNSEINSNLVSLLKKT